MTKSPASWLPRDRDLLRAQRSLIECGITLPFSTWKFIRLGKQRVACRLSAADRRAWCPTRRQDYVLVSVTMTRQVALLTSFQGLIVSLLGRFPSNPSKPNGFLMLAFNSSRQIRSFKPWCRRDWLTPMIAHEILAHICRCTQMKCYVARKILDKHRLYKISM